MPRFTTLPGGRQGALRAQGPHRAPLGLLLGVLLLFFVRFGYDYGASDQDEFVPLVLHRLDPSLFSTDWFVQLQAADFGVRTGFVLLLQGLATLIPVWLAALLLYLGAWLLVAAAVYTLAYLLTGEALAAAFCVLAALVLTPQWTLGGNDLAPRMLAPSMLGWGLGLWGICCFLQARPVLAGALLGAATWMQALVGLQLAGLLGLASLTALPGTGPDKPSLRRILLLAGAYLLTALPVLLPLGLGQVAAAPTAVPSRFYIQAAFRNPHHYLFFSFPARSLLGFGLLAGLGLLALAYLHRQGRLRHAGFVGRALLVVTLLGGVAFFSGEVYPFLPLAQLQLFKPTVFAKLLFLAAIGGAAARLLPSTLRRAAGRSLHARWLPGLALAGWLLVLTGLLGGWAPLLARVPPLARSLTPPAQVEAWARCHTPRDAVFAVPPSWDAFRTQAQRSIVVNFKAFPFEAVPMQAWFERLLDLAPIVLPERGGGPVLPLLDAAYAAQPAAGLAALASRYGFSYVVRPTPLPEADDDFEEVFAAPPWHVYRVRPSTAPGL